jgi:hypothetical protein
VSTKKQHKIKQFLRKQIIVPSRYIKNNPVV